MMCFDRGTATRSSRLNMPVVPANVCDKIMPLLAKMWSSLLPTTNDRSMLPNYLLAQGGNISSHCDYMCDELTDLYDTMFQVHSTILSDKRNTSGFNFLKALESDLFRSLDHSYCTKPRESLLCTSVAKNLTTLKNSLSSLLPSPKSSLVPNYQSNPNCLPFDKINLQDTFDKINLQDMIMASTILLRSGPPDSQAPILPCAAANAAVKKMEPVNCDDRMMEPDRTSTCNEPRSRTVVLSTLQTISPGVTSSRQNGKRVATVENMNNQLIQRKSQKMNKNNKKRRRRQKKRKPNLADTKSHLKECESVARKSTPMHLGSDSEDDSLSGTDHVADIKISIQCLQTASPERAASSISFFIQQLTDSGTDEEEWDCDDSAVASAVEDFEFPCLTAGLSSIHISGSARLSIDCDTSMSDGTDTFCHISFIEIELSPELKEVNCRWERIMSSVPSVEKTPDKVSFAEEKDLVKEYPVDSYDRRGEWERYATERFRFKRRIQETESILAPVLTPAHRKKVLEQQKMCKQS